MDTRDVIQLVIALFVGYSLAVWRTNRKFVGELMKLKAEMARLKGEVLSPRR